MKIMSLVPIINCAFNYVVRTSKIFNIDESHALKHSMEVFQFANKIYESESKNNTLLQHQKDIIMVSAIIHDMCDKKYMNENEGIGMIKHYMSDYMSATNLEVVSNIISTMSYSKVKINGYPNLGEYQLAYHIVREADLLAGYDIDRCIIYSMMCEKLSYHDSIKRALNLFDVRVLKYRDDKLFVTKYSKKLSLQLHKKSLKDIEHLKSLHDTL